MPTVSGRLLYVFFVISHARRRVLRADVTEHPTAWWIGQQLREAFPDGATPRYLILDRDSTFDRQVLVSVENMSIKPVRTAFRSPWQNGVAERWVESCRRDVMDHVLVLNERHARRLLADTSGTITKIALTMPWRRTRRCVGPSPSVPLHNRRSLGFPEWAACITGTNGPGRLELGLTIRPSTRQS